jgi:hypothetical protein
LSLEIFVTLAAYPVYSSKIGANETTSPTPSLGTCREGHLISSLYLFLSDHREGGITNSPSPRSGTADVNPPEHVPLDGPHKVVAAPRGCYFVYRIINKSLF